MHRRHNQTEFIEIDLGLCTACGRCNASCRREVLGQVKFFWHRHVHVDRAADCTGCQRCVKVCPQQAIHLQTANVDAV